MNVLTMLRDWIVGRPSARVRLYGHKFAAQARTAEEEDLRQRTAGLNKSIDGRIRLIFRACDQLGVDVDEQMSRAVAEAEQRLRR